MKRLFVFAMALALFAVMVSSASADDGTLKGDIRINPNDVVIEPPQYPEVASSGEVTVEGGTLITVIVTS